MALSEDRLCSIIESLLLIAGEPLPLDRIVEVIRGEDPKTAPEDVRDALERLAARYGDPERKIGAGLTVREVGGAVQMRTTPENAQYVRRLLAARPQRLSRPALETLAIVAYRQPVTKPEIESIRGVDCGAVLKALLERDLVRILGKKDEVGRPILYGTTQAFLELFGLKSLAALPTLREYHELDDEHQAQVDALYEAERPSITSLAATAEFLIEREDDPDLQALDAALEGVDRVRKATSAFLGEGKSDDQSDSVETSVEEDPEASGQEVGAQGPAQ